VGVLSYDASHGQELRHLENNGQDDQVRIHLQYRRNRTSCTSFWHRIRQVEFTWRFMRTCVRP